MPNLHVYYYHGNVKAFRQELDGTSPGSTNGQHGRNGGGVGSGSVGKSWTLGGFAGAPVKADPNERDSLGRTVLHLAASSLTAQSYSFLSMLLRNPNISVNLQDYESGYTALHRALFSGNIRAARDLLARGDIDVSIKDMEGLTAFDLYNGTVDGTNPPRDAQGTDLYVWGVNRNFALGTGDTSDKAYPDRVNLQTQSQVSSKPDPAQRFYHVGVHDVVMSKLHTAAVTTEDRGNLSICGFGSNGRLGRTVHSQLALLPMGDLPQTIVSVSLGQDHSLALTSGGYILSWGHNRFSQLGYIIDPPENPVPGRSKDDEQVQVSPRRIVGPMKKEWVRGVAAGRMSSACWTADSVWTWGTNAGHLGYEKAANPVQVLPRKVTTLTQPVIDIALSDYAMICLLDTFEVICFHHDVNFRIGFSTPKVLSESFPFRPPQSTIKPMIEKVTSSGTTFAALSSIGDVFTFALPNPLEDVSKDARDRHVTVKPQLIWALRKSFTAVKDVALGSDGTVIICTHSGHVFVRQRVKSGSGQLKFRRIPYLQRAVKVACNESGAFAVIREDAKATRITLVGRTLEEDLGLLQPHFNRFDHQMTAEDFDREAGVLRADEDEEDESMSSIAKDIKIATRLCTILRRWGSDARDSLFSWDESLLGSDVFLTVGDIAIPAHGTVLALRSPAFGKILAGKPVTGFTPKAHGRIAVNVCHPMVVLLLLQYLYTDDVAAIWDARLVRLLQTKFSDLKLDIPRIKADLKAVAETLQLCPLSTVLDSAAKTSVGKRTLNRDLQAFFVKTASMPETNSACDLTIVLADRQVACSSVILRARCPFFEAMFAEPDWTAARQTGGSVVVQMTHLKWRPMRMVFRYIHEGLEDDLFDYLHQETLDEFLDFVFEVLAAATELLMDRLILVCSRVIIRHCNAYNAAALACEAAFYQATTLKHSVFDYIVSCMETMLESGLLDDMHEDVLLELCQHISTKQVKKLGVARSSQLVNQAMERQKDWLAMQDIPVPRVRQAWKWKPKSPALSPVDTMPLTSVTITRRRETPSPVASPELPPSTSDDMFTMDDLQTPQSTSGRYTPKALSRPMTPLDLSSGSKGAVWKSRAAESDKVDLRSIMAEASASKTPSRPGPAPTGRTPTASERRSTPLTASSSVFSPSRSTGAPATMTPGSSGSAGPWRTPSSSKTSLAAVQSQQTAASPSLGSSPKGGRGSVSRTSSQVITPVKLQPAPPGTTRKVSSGAAWTAAASSSFAPPPVAPIISPDSRSFSLLAIQQQERDYADRAVRKTNKSFAEIQAEEREAEASKVQEEEFMRWWEEEQARINGDSGPAGAGGSRGGGAGGGRGGRVGRGARGGGGGAPGKAAQRKVPPQNQASQNGQPGPSAGLRGGGPGLAGANGHGHRGGRGGSARGGKPNQTQQNPSKAQPGSGV